MNLEDKLLNLLILSPKSVNNHSIAEKLELNHNFTFRKNRNDLKGVWDLRWSSSNSPF